MPAHSGCARKRVERPRHEVADIFRAHGEEYRATHVLTPQQRQVMRDIETCRTAVLGGHLEVCLDCGDETQAYNSCNNRHCPKCQALAQARWLAKRQRRILPTAYFHVVFTLPAELRPLARRNPKRLYGLMFQAASQTLLTLGRDPQRLGALIGITAVLHTWRRDLGFHPHLHCIVTGGGLALDEDRWVEGNAEYLFPRKVMASLFRGKLLDGITRAHQRDPLLLTDDLDRPGAFEQMRSKLYSTDWQVYAKRPFAGAQQVFDYLGRYTHRVGLSNRRILEHTAHRVTIATRGDGAASMHPHEFIRRFLMHVVPKGFVKIRHYGLLASSNVNTKLVVARRLLGVDDRDHEDGDSPEGLDDWHELMLAITGIDVRACPVCGSTRRIRIPLAEEGGYPEPIVSCRSP